MSARGPALVVLAAASLVVAACSGAAPGSQTGAGDASAAATPEIPERYALKQSPDYTITVTTTAFGGTFNRLNRQHGCERGDTSPDLRWEGVPEGAESLALVMEDPASDVHGFSVDVLWAHWVVYSIPPDVTELEPGQAAGDVLELGAKQGTNDYERVQYNGPCPIPTFTIHGTQQFELASSQIKAEDRPYYFRLYALDVAIDLPPGADRDTLLEAIDGHVLAAGEMAINYKSIKSAPCHSDDPEVCLKSVRR
jgi:hypothetical protein